MNKVFGRDEIIAILDKRIEGFKKGYRQNIALIGSPLTGKTSILRMLLSDMDSCAILPIYIKLNARSLRQIIHGIFNQILRPFLKSQNIDTSTGDFMYLQGKSQAFLPKTTAKIKVIDHNLDKGKDCMALLDTFELAQIFFEESNKPCLLMLDEFQDLECFGGEDIFVELARKIVVQKNTMYLITSSSRIKAKEILSQSLSLLFGNFEVLEIEPYSIFISDGFITKNLEFEMRHTHKRFLIDFTFGHPFYLDRFCRELSLQAIRHNLDFITEGVFIEAFENLLFEEWGTFNQRFINLLDKISSDRQRENYIAILSSIIYGHNKIKAIATDVDKKEKIIQQRISRLYDTGLIIKNGDFLCLTDKVFAFWLKFSYNKKMEFDYLDEETLRLDFRNNLLSIMNNFFIVLRQTAIERIVELFNLFKNESVQMERKKIVLSHFKEIRLLKLEKGSFDAIILAESPDVLWIVAVKNGLLSDADIAEFISECKKYRSPKSQRKIIITLNEKIDMNTKLKALEEKVMTWETSYLNSLFGLYNKPAIFV